MTQVRIDIGKDDDLGTMWRVFKATVGADNNTAALRHLFEVAGLSGEDDMSEFVSLVRDDEEPGRAIRFGSVQHDYITRLRAALLKNGRVPTYDLSFTQGANLAVVIAMAFHHADEYLDRHGLHGEMPVDTAAAQIASDYLVDGDLPPFIKDNFGSYADYFADQIVMCGLTDDPGVPSKEWWDQASVDRDEFNELFTAEPPES